MQLVAAGCTQVTIVVTVRITAVQALQHGILLIPRGTLQVWLWVQMWLCWCRCLWRWQPHRVC